MGVPYIPWWMMTEAVRDRLAWKKYDKGSVLRIRTRYQSREECVVLGHPTPSPVTNHSHTRKKRYSSRYTEKPNVYGVPAHGGRNSRKLLSSRLRKGEMPVALYAVVGLNVLPRGYSRRSIQKVVL